MIHEDQEDTTEAHEILTISIDSDRAGLRADKALVSLCKDISRTRLQALIAQGNVTVNGEILLNASRKLIVDDVLVITVPPPVACDPVAENIPLDIIYEDEFLLVINKRAGMVVHPGSGNWTGTLVHALLYHCGESLSGIGGVVRPGIVHRLDKDTSGLMIVAKTDFAHQHLAMQLSDRLLTRVYHAIVLGVPQPLKGLINRPIGRHHTNRQKMSTVSREPREARTHYRVLERFAASCSSVECRLETGRTHQIRVHMEFLGHPLIGDPLYGPQITSLKSRLRKGGYRDEAIEEICAFSRQALHSSEISFLHPYTEEDMHFEVSPPSDILKLLETLKNL